MKSDLTGAEIKEVLCRNCTVLKNDKKCTNEKCARFIWEDVQAIIKAQKEKRGKK